MPRIGTFEVVDDRLVGSITALGMTMTDVTVVPIKPRHPNGAPFMLFKDRCDVGRAWPSTTRDGVEHLAVQLDSPLLAEPIACKLFRVDQSNSYRLFWTRNTGPAETPEMDEATQSGEGGDD